MKSSKIYYAPVEESIEASTVTMRNILEHRAFRLCRSFYRQQLIGLHLSSQQSLENQEIILSFIKNAAESLKGKKSWSFICDTSNYHKKILQNAIEQIQYEYSPSLNELRHILPFFMLDGLNGNYEHICRSPNNSMETYIAGEVPNLDGLILFSTPFEHKLCGVANALFSVGVETASKRGKIKLHTQNKPQINVTKCYACRRCLHACPVDAISMGDNHVILDDNKCIDCGKCVEIAEKCGVSYSWNATPEYFQERMLLQADSVVKILSGKIIFISIIPVSKNGVELVISRDPVAVDAATLEILKTNNKFNVNLLASFEEQIKAANNLKIGNMKYKKEAVAY